MKGDRYNAMTDFHAIVLLMMVLHGYLITLVNAETFSRFTKRDIPVDSVELIRKIKQSPTHRSVNDELCQLSCHTNSDCMVARSDHENGYCIIGKLVDKDTKNETHNDIEKTMFMFKEEVTNRDHRYAANIKIGKACWKHCSEKPGPCGWCGEGSSGDNEGMCCRLGYGGHEQNGCDGTIGGSEIHRCSLRKRKEKACNKYETFGPNLVPVEEGQSAGSKWNTNVESCKSACNQKTNCNSFAFCNTGKACYFKEKKLIRSEKTKSHGDCTTYFKSCDPQNYFLTKKGELCKHYDSQRLETYGECKAAINILNQSNSTLKLTKKSWSNWPKGCFFFIGYRSYGFNTHETGRSSGTKHATNVCKRKEKLTRGEQGTCPNGSWTVNANGRRITNWGCCKSCPGGTRHCYGDCGCKCSAATKCEDIDSEKNGCDSAHNCEWNPTSGCITLIGSTTNKTTRPTTYENTGKTTLELTTTQNKATSSSTTEIATQALPTTNFTGYCRYGNPSESKWSKIDFGITATSAEDCFEKCQNYGKESIENELCTAFSFEPKQSENCDLYRDGPYTYGDDNPKVACYVMSNAWQLYAEKAECSGSEINKGSLQALADCALRCSGVSSMFAFGTNDYGATTCTIGGCNCFCEIAATVEGTCNMKNTTRYRLYRYELYKLGGVSITHCPSGYDIISTVDKCEKASRFFGFDHRKNRAKNESSATCQLFKQDDGQGRTKVVTKRGKDSRLVCQKAEDPHKVMLKSGYECSSNDYFLDYFSNVDQCTDACKKKKGCRFFIYGKRERCYWEKTQSASCPEGWKENNYVFYELRGTPENTIVMPITSDSTAISIAVTPTGARQTKRGATISMSSLSTTSASTTNGIVLATTLTTALPTTAFIGATPTDTAITPTDTTTTKDLLYKRTDTTISNTAITTTIPSILKTTMISTNSATTTIATDTHTTEKRKPLYEPYISGEKKTCDTKHRIGKGRSGRSLEQCEERCIVHDNCKFFFYTKQNKWCSIFDACNERRSTGYKGDTFKKNVALGSTTTRATIPTTFMSTGPETLAQTTTTALHMTNNTTIVMEEVTSYSKFGLNLVAGNRGNTVRRKQHPSTLRDCAEKCNKAGKCKSFDYCPGPQTCQLRDKALYGHESTAYNGACTTYFRKTGLCPDEFITHTSNGFMFCYNPGVVNYTTAKQNCESNGMHLVEITSTEKSTAHASVANLINTRTWIGLTCPTGGGNCQWNFSLWTWEHSNKSLTDTKGWKNRFIKESNARIWQSGSKKKCVNWGNSNGRWAPERCSRTNAETLCEF